MNTNSRKNLVILGMHRSGTSLLANWLKECGLNIGNILIGSDSSNPHGHFEDIDFYNLHEEILKYNKIPWGGFENLHPLHLNTYFKKKLEYLLKFKSELNYQWGWKEPRTCLFLEFYRQLLPNAFYIIIYRDYNQVVSSLIRRDIIKEKTRLLNSGRLGKIRVLVKNYKDQIINNRKDIYLNAWIYYNKQIIDFISSTKSQYILFPNTKLRACDKKIINKLLEFGFNFNSIPVKSVFDDSLVSKHTKNYTFDYHLVKNAENILDSLNSYKTY